MACSLAQSNPELWKRHILGYVDARTWLRRAGRLSTLRIRVVRGKWPYARIDGKPVKFPKTEEWLTDGPPLDPRELLRSVTTDDFFSLFTCECSEPQCRGISSGVYVGHSNGLVVWRFPEEPSRPVAVFDDHHYRIVVHSAIQELLRKPPQSSGLTWAMSVRPERLRHLLSNPEMDHR